MLEEMFVRLDLQVSQMVREPEPMENHAQKQEIPAIFSGLSEARERLVSHWHVVSHSTSDVWDSSNEKLCTVPLAGAWQKKSISILARWSSVYDVYLNIQGENLTDRKRKGTAVLNILKELGSTAMVLTKTTVDDQENWDVFCSMFQKIVSLAEDIVEVDQNSTAGMPTFCIDMALIGPLFASTPPTGKKALTNVRVFDGWRIRKPSTVVIDGDSITFNLRDIQNTIDGEGGVLLPGLIDSHIHLSSLDSLDTLSSYGVTTVMNMGCTNYTLCSALRDQTGLTSFITAGEGAVAPNSTHATVFGAKGFVNSPAQAPQFVENVFGNGSNFIKIISEPNGFNQAIHDVLVRTTHSLGKTAMTHAQDYGSYEVAIRSKTNGLQHVPFDIPLTEEMAQRIKNQAQHVTPTLNIGKIVTSNSTIESIISGGIDLTYEAGVTSVQRLMRAGVPILAGTDAIDAAGSFLKGDLIGITLHQELQYLTEAGMSEVDALRATTVVPSIWHNLVGRGSIREGYRADLLLLKPGSNPLRNISKTMYIARVWNAGIEYVPVARVM
ncbi:hypothetical protein VE03_04001 [Pseudogymnoascus sp. 23342-1-I1]|nr:hypothetical protein VE03_04001 [Pseudogymnoascus sp. 23342-1-I1]